MGVDWGKVSSVYAFGEGEKPPKTRAVSNRVGGLTSICEELMGLSGGTPVVVAIEAGAPAVTTWLVDAGFTVHVVDGKQARRFVESMASGGSKNDATDARYAWHMAQSPMHLGPPETLVPDADRALEIAVRARDQLSKRLTRNFGITQ